MFSSSPKSTMQPLPHRAGAYDTLMHRINNVPTGSQGQPRYTGLRLMTDRTGMALGGTVLDNGVQRELAEHEIVALACAHIDAVYAAKSDQQASAGQASLRPEPLKPAVALPSTKSPSPVQRTVDAYCRTMAIGAANGTPGEYGTEVEIQAIAEALQLEITVFAQGIGSARDPNQGPGVPVAARTFRPIDCSGPLEKIAIVLQHHNYAARNDDHFRPLPASQEQLSNLASIDEPTLLRQIGHAASNGDCLFASLGALLGRSPSAMRAIAVSWLRFFASNSPAFEVDVERQQLSVVPYHASALKDVRTHL